MAAFMEFLRSVDVHVVRSEPFPEAVAGFFRAEGNDVEFEVDLVGSSKEATAAKKVA